MINDSNQFSRDAWEANAEVWDARMGDEGNDFFNMACSPIFGKTLVKSWILFCIITVLKNFS
jgi:hypothetical protein